MVCAALSNLLIAILSSINSHAGLRFPDPAFHSGQAPWASPRTPLIENRGKTGHQTKQNQTTSDSSIDDERGASDAFIPNVRVTSSGNTNLPFTSITLSAKHQYQFWTVECFNATAPFLPNPKEHSVTRATSLVTHIRVQTHGELDALRYCIIIRLIATEHLSRSISCPPPSLPRKKERKNTTTPCLD